VEDIMATSDIQPTTLVDQQQVVRSAISGTLHVAFVAIVSVGLLFGTGFVFWLLSVLAHSSYGIYFGL
jgi:nitrate reductase NapE component